MWESDFIYHLSYHLPSLSPKIPPAPVGTKPQSRLDKSGEIELLANITNEIPTKLYDR